MHIAQLTNFVAANGCEVVTDSRIVARQFEKQHAKVLRSIRQLISQTGHWGRANFGECFEINDLANGKREPLFRISKDGFMLLVMGFTGRKALEMKLAFIEAFNAMAELIRTGLWPTRLAAEADRQREANVGSDAGRALRRWRDVKPICDRRIAELDKQMQLVLLPN